ncbi:MAG: D-glycero-alpha-D-manno-heptose-1,7-bisphosphate 7-phosphatase [Nitrospinota bacterium]
MKKVKVAYLDRDGTINVEKNYLGRPEDVELIPGSAKAIQKLNEAGYRVFGISNQAGVARGYFKIEDVHAVNKKVIELVAEGRGTLEEIFYCPHHPEGALPEYTKICGCRKPAVGMIEQAVEKYGLKPSETVVIGDRTLDIELGRRLGATTILVHTGYGMADKEKIVNEKLTPPDLYAKDLLDAVTRLLENKDS